MADEENFDKLTIEERCVHKSWKARISGYSCAVKRFDDITDERSDEWNKYVPIIKAILEENNDPALEKGMEVVLSFVSKSAATTKIVGDIVAGLVKRSVASSRARTRELSLQICLAAVEIGKQKIVIDELLKGTESKSPKISTNCINILTETVKAFGTSVLPIDGIVQKLPVLLDDKDLNVRNAAKTLTVEVYHWLGDDLRLKLLKPDVLKPQKLAEIVSEIAKIEARVAVPSRFLKSQQNRGFDSNMHADTETSPNEEYFDNENHGVTEIDENEEHSDSVPVNLISRIPEEFFSNIISPKWAERRGALEGLEKILQGVDRIENGEYSSIISQLTHIISKDANVAVVCLAVKCVKYFAQKLRKDFSKYGAVVFRALMEKLKEKKPFVVETLREGMDAVSECAGVEPFIEELTEGLKNKSPNVKSECALFLSRRFSRLSPTSLIRLKPVFPTLTTCLSDQDPNVRDGAAKALGVALRIAGDKNLSPLFKDLEKTKLTKINEYATSVPSESKVRKTPAHGSAQTKQSTKSKLDNVESIQELGKKNSAETESCKKTLKAHHRKMKRKITDSLPEGTMRALTDKDWSVRVEAILEIQKTANLLPSDVTIELGDLVPLLCFRILDGNPKISTATLNLVTSLADRFGPLFGDFRNFLPALFKALGDAKIKDATVDCLNKLGEKCGYMNVIRSDFLTDCLKSGTSTAKSNLWRWISEISGENWSDASQSDLESLLPSLFSSLEDRNADVRSAASRGVEGFLRFLNVETMVNICERFYGNSNNGVVKIILSKQRSLFPEPKDPQEAGTTKYTKPPSIGSRKKVTFAESVENSSILDINELKNQRVIDEHRHKIAKWDFVTPRAEFVEMLKGLMSAANFSPELLKMLFHSDFRCHIKAMDMLMEEININSRAIICNLDLILRWLTLRFYDGNPTVLAKSLDFVIKALGILKETNYCLLDSEASAFVPYLVLKLGDSKENVQSKVKEILETLTSVYPVSKLKKLVLEGARSNIARQRANCLEVLASYVEKYGEPVYTKDFDSVSEAVGKLLKDRDAVVKKKAFHLAALLYDREGETITKMMEKQLGDDFRSFEARIRRYVGSNPFQNQINQPELGNRVGAGSPLAENITTDCPSELQPAQPFIPCDMKSKSGKFHWDEQLVRQVDDLTKLIPEPAEIVDIDLEFLKECPASAAANVGRKFHPNIPLFYPPNPVVLSNNPSFMSLIENVANDDLISSKNSKNCLVRLFESRPEMLLDWVDLLLRKIVQNLQKLGNRSVNEDVVENYRSAFSLLMTLCNERLSIERFSEERLHDVMEQLLLALSDGKEMYNAFRKTVNAIILKILDCSRKTLLLCALLRLMSDTRKQETSSGRLHELSMKCVWKFVRNQASYDDELGYPAIFSAIRDFLRPFPRPWWKSNGDPALRTVKSILRAMLKLRGDRIFQDIDNDDDEIRQYFLRLLKSTSVKCLDESRAEGTPCQNPTSSHSKEPSAVLGEIALRSQDGFREFENSIRQHQDGIGSKNVGGFGKTEGTDGHLMSEGRFGEEIRRMWDTLETLQEKIAAFKDS